MLSNIDHLKLEADRRELEAVVRRIRKRRSNVSWFTGQAVLFAVLVVVSLSEEEIVFALLAGAVVAIALLGIWSERRKIAGLQADREQLEARLGAQGGGFGVCRSGSSSSPGPSALV